MKRFFQEERRILRKGFKRIAGLDEAGRGPLAGPVIACAVFAKPGLIITKADLVKIQDSKKLNPKTREEFYDILTKHPKIKWGIGRVSEKVIDKINIFRATKLAMKRALVNMKLKPDFLILDGNFRIDSSLPQLPIIKADEKVFSCMAAGIIAKVTRDRMMERYHKKYPRYCFSKHKGYPTKLHRRLLKRYGRCAIHRYSFNYRAS